MKPAVFLDRDGVVNEVLFRDAQPVAPRSVSDFVLRPGIREAVLRLREAGFLVFVVSNQPDVARGFLGEEVLEELTARVRGAVPVDDIAICRHDDRDGCACRKPLPGMLTALAARWEVDLGRSFMVGDTWKDVAAGSAAGCTTVLLDAPYNRATDADVRAADPQDAAARILARSRQPV